ncbi:phosphotransferase enzyme family protein [Heyndrickxia sp. NPDC080065]|uniref:phosphotransferase enzyme family protein n=1 Tax=Heyndrickxia sp. NPDC080065 TaxID=3390568 RepID=UPI003CFDDF51
MTIVLSKEEIILKVINEKYPVKIHYVEGKTNEMWHCSGINSDYYARITNYKTYEEQFQEVKWTNYLFEHGVGVSPAIYSLEGNIIETGMFPEKKRIVLYKAAPGIHLPRSKWGPQIFKELGRQIGIMHRITKQYEQKESIDHLRDWYENEEYQFLKYIPEEEATIRELSQAIFAKVQALQKNNTTYGLLHADLWLENVLVDDQSKITMIDFQDCEKHYYLYDLVVPIYSALEFSFSGNGNIKDYGHAITESIFEGYLMENNIPSEMLEHFPLFLKLKEIFEYHLMHMYWDKDKLSEEQVRILNHYRIRLENNFSII